MSLETTGVIHELYDEKQITESFKKREFVLKIEDGKYEQFVLFQMTQDRVDILDKYKKGDSVTVSFNLSGKPYTNKEGETKYFSNLTAWKVQKVESEAPAPVAEEDEENLPF